MSALKKETCAELSRRVLKAHGIPMVHWGEDKWSLCGIPSKWAGVITDLTTAFTLRELGEPVVLAKEPLERRAAKARRAK